MLLDKDNMVSLQWIDDGLYKLIVMNDRIVTLLAHVRRIGSK